MASQLRVNKSENRSGLGTITYTDTGAIVSGIVTANSFSGDIIGDITGAVTATTGSFSGDVSIAEKIIHTGDTNTFMKFDTDTVTFETAGDQRIRIDSVGDIFIGTTSDIAPANGTNLCVSDGTIARLILEKQSTIKYGLNVSSGFTIYDETNDAARLTIKSNGNIGVNNDNPQRILHVGTSGSAEANIRIQGGSDYGEIRVKDSDNALTFHHNVGGAGSREMFSSNGSTGHFSINCYSYQALTITTNESGTNGPEIQLMHNTTSPAANDVVGQLRYSGKDSAGNTELYAKIQTKVDDATSGQETGHIDFSTRGLGAYNSIFRLKARGSASAPSYTADDMNGIILDTYNTGNPYPRYMNFIAKSAGNTDSNIAFWTESVGGSPTEKLRITSDGFVGINESDPQTKLAVRGTITSGRNLAREVGTIINISHNYSSGRSGTNVINGNKNYEAGEDWLTPSNQRVNANLTIDLGAQYNCDRFVIYNQNEYQDSNREVKNFTLEGSNDNSSWTTILDDNCGASGAHEPNPGFSFRIPASYYDDSEGASYRYWRFTMKSFHGGGNGGHGGIMELELYEHTTTIHCTSEISTSSVVAGDMSAETLQGIKRLYASKGMSVYTGGLTDTWEITEYGIVPSGSYENKSTIRHKRGVMAVSSSYNTGDLYVRIDNLYNLPGNAWWVCGVFIVSNEIAGNQTGSHHYVTSLQLMGIGTWNSVSTANIVGSMSCSVAASGSNWVELFINVNDSSRGPCTVIATGPFDPPNISFA